MSARSLLREKAQRAVPRTLEFSMRHFSAFRSERPVVFGAGEGLVRRPLGQGACKLGWKGLVRILLEIEKRIKVETSGGHFGKGIWKTQRLLKAEFSIQPVFLGDLNFLFRVCVFEKYLYQLNREELAHWKFATKFQNVKNVYFVCFRILLVLPFCFDCISCALQSDKRTLSDTLNSLLKLFNSCRCGKSQSLHNANKQKI